MRLPSNLHLAIVAIALLMKPLISKGFRSSSFAFLRRNAPLTMSSITTTAAAVSSVAEVAVGSGTTSNRPVSHKTTPPLIVNTYVDKELLHALDLKNHLRKSRLLVSTKTKESWTITKLRELIETRYPQLENKPYKLRYRPHPEADINTELKSFTNDDELVTVFNDFFHKGQSVQLFLQVNPGVFPENVPISADPLETDAYTLVSFYAFADIADPQELSYQFRATWEAFRAVGRIYIAKEGINAQMAVPSNVFKDFMKATRAFPFFKDVRFNVDHEMTREDYLQQQPFHNLHIRCRKQIVADGFDEELDWSRAGKELLPLEWHEQISDPNAIILDCRNTYETDIGKFKNAIPLNTTVFRESWDAMEEILKDTPKDAPIYTYCTGGIRCVKINAFLEQKLGFNNTHRLKGGIIYYTKTLEHVEAGAGVEIIDPTLKYIKPEEKPQHNRHLADSKFLGVNYVFDDRFGARITADVFTTCGTCGSSCDTFTNCKNDDCNVLYIQCEKCRSKYGGCCSKACEAQHNSQHTPAAKKVAKKFSGKVSDIKTDFFQSQSAVPEQTISSTVKVVKSHANLANAFAEALNSYSEQHSVKETSLLEELRKETESSYDKAVSRMVSGPSQGAMLSLLATISNAKKVLELGTFTGYSALCLASNFGHWSTSLSDKKDLNAEQVEQVQNSARVVHTCEIDNTYADVAQKYFDRSAVGDKIHIHRSSAAETMASFRESGEKFDIVFIDANKKDYLNYLKDVIGENGKPSLVNAGGLILVDNTLWKGLVLHKTEEFKKLAPNAEDFGAAGRMMKVTDVIHDFNEFAAAHPNLRALQLPMRDGFTILQYSP